MGITGDIWGYIGTMMNIIVIGGIEVSSMALRYVAL